MGSKNNRGSTLVNVVICILFISMMGVVLVGSTINNVKIQQKQKQKDDAFYNCETAMNEITTGIRQLVAESVQFGYLDALQHYTTPGIDLSDTYNTACINHLTSEIKNPIAVASNEVASTKLLDYVHTNVSCVKVENALFEVYEDATDTRYAKKHVRIKGIQVTFQRPTTNPAEKANRSVTIKTDLVVKFPSLNMALPSAESGTMPEFGKYAIIAEGGITYTGNIAGEARITGNVYAGQNGILAQGPKKNLMISSQDIIIKGNLQADNQAIIQIYSIDGVTKPNLWANNIVTMASNRNTILPTTIDIHGNCFVYDDMNVEAINSLINVKGNYFGYTKHSVDKTGSSILMNGANSTLNISGGNLVLGGYAYIGFAQNHLSGVNAPWMPLAFDTSKTTKVGEILTSDSLGIKSNQLMYLIGSSCFKTDSSGYMRSNPIPYNLCKDNLSTQAKIFEIIDKSTLESTYSLTMPYYILPVVYKTKNADSTDNESIVYFYICFNKKDHAETDLNGEVTNVKSFVDSYSWSDALTKDFKLHEISLNSTNMYSAGYLYNYSNDMTASPSPSINQTNLKGESNVHNFSELPDTITDVDLTEPVQVADLPTQYASLTKVLSKTEPTGLTATNPYDYYIESTDSNYNQKMKDDYSNASEGETYRYHVVIKNGDYTVEASECGIIIASGNVSINANFEGLIIAKGKVTLGNGVNVTYNPDNVKELIAHLPSDLKDAVFCSDSLPDAGSSGSSSSETQMNLDDLVTYSNWHKG